MVPLDINLLSGVLAWAIKINYQKYFYKNDTSDERFDSNWEYNLTKDVYHTSMVTSIKEGVAFLGDKYSFNISKVNRDVYVGTIVTCIVNSDGPGTITDITVIDILDEETEDIPLEGNDKKSGVVVKREGRIFHVSPGPISFNLDNVAAKFIPEIGDVIEMVVNSAIVEEEVLTSVLSINPMGYKVVYGTITLYEELSGFINDTVVFQAHHCQPGYMPNLGDQVVFSTIRCQSGSARQRAIHVNPVSTQKNNLNLNFELSDIIFQPKEIIHLNVNEIKSVETQIKNNSDSPYKLLSITAHTTESTVELIDPVDVKMTLMPKSTTKFIFNVSVKFIGFSTISFDFVFEDYIFNFELNLLALSETPHCVERNIENKNTAKLTDENQAVKPVPEKPPLVNHQFRKAIPGRRFNKPCRFIPVKMGFYNVPTNLISLFESGEKMVTKSDLEQVLPCLQYGLKPNSYNIFFHSLIHLEEISLLEKISRLEILSGFEFSGDFLTLYVGEESNFSLLHSGDKVYARKPWNGIDDVYEGIIWNTHPGELNIKFSSYFHETYSPGSEYILTFTTGRNTFRLKHQAIDDICSFLGIEWLFPEKANLKSPIIIPVSKPSEEDFVATVKPKKMMWNRQGSGYGSKQVIHNVDQDIPSSKKTFIRWFNIDLNEEQKNAVINSLQGVSRPLPYIIFGPPGTGKSFTMIELILQVYNIIPQSKLLVAAPSNSAADLLAINLISSGFVKTDDFTRLVGYRYARSSQIPVGLIDHVALAEIRDDREGDHEFDLKKLNRKCLSEKRIIVGTLSTLGTLRSMGFPRGYFTHFFIDEAGQVMEPEGLIITGFMNMTGQLILAGDPLQLGPTVISRHAHRYGLNKSLLQRFMEFCLYSVDKVGFPNSLGFNPKFVTKLIKSYRSLPGILELSNKLFYHNELQSMVEKLSSEEAKLYHLLKPIFPKESRIPVMFYSVKGEEMLESGSYSFYNLEEVFQVCSFICRLYKFGIKPVNIGVITPYLAQSKKINEYLSNLKCEAPKIGSVEEFQGQERDVIILSTVRSSLIDDDDTNDNVPKMGFIFNPQRINVALTRAKSVLILVGNYSTLCNNEIWKTVISFCIDNKSFSR